MEKDHAAVISLYQDRDVGRIMHQLDQVGIAEDTVVFFARCAVQMGCDTYIMDKL